MKKTLSNRSKTKDFYIHGKLVRTVSISGLAQYLGKSRDSILRYERMATFPGAPISCKGYRYYPEFMLSELKTLVDKFSPNKPPDPEIIAEINSLFKETIEKLKSHA